MPEEKDRERSDNASPDSAPKPLAGKELPSKPSGPDSAVNPEGAIISASRQADVEDFVAHLADEEKMLVLLKGELYEGSWQAMLTDLHNRLEGKPFIFKLANRIRDDIARIEKLQAFEKQHQVDLTRFIKPPRT